MANAASQGSAPSVSSPAQLALDWLRTWMEGDPANRWFAVRRLRHEEIEKWCVVLWTKPMNELEDNYEAPCGMHPTSIVEAARLAFEDWERMPLWGRT